MTDLSIPDASELEELVRRFADDYLEHPLVRINVAGLKDVLDGDAWTTNWRSIYEDLEQIRLRSTGAISERAAGLMDRIEFECLIGE